MAAFSLSTNQGRRWLYVTVWDLELGLKPSFNITRIHTEFLILLVHM